MEASSSDPDLDFDSVVDNFCTAFLEEGIDWISLAGFTGLSDTMLAEIASMTPSRVWIIRTI